MRRDLASFLAGGALTTFFVSASAHAEVPISSDPVVLDFDDYQGFGFVPEPELGQLDSDTWSIEGLSAGDLPFGGSGTSSDFARGPSSGGVTQGGMYSFNVDGADNHAFGWQASSTVPGDLLPGAIFLALRNNNNLPITRFQIDYRMYVFDDSDGASTIQLEFSSDGAQWIPLFDTPYSSPRGPAKTPAWESEMVTATADGISVPAGQAFFLRWALGDRSGGVSEFRDDLAIDNLTLTVVGECGDGSLQPGEPCDEGIVDTLDPDFRNGCGGDCVFYCGDGRLDPLENCDVGIIDILDPDFHNGCGDTCMYFCGDGNRNEGEECDDANTLNGDGCSDACQVETDIETSGTATSGSGGGSGDEADTTAGALSSTGTTSGLPLPTADTTEAALGQLDDDGCVCRSRGRSSTGWGLGLLVLLALRRRRD